MPSVLYKSLRLYMVVHYFASCQQQRQLTFDFLGIMMQID